MKYYKRLKVYKTSNCVFNPETMHATSYRWYDLLKMINGKVVLNTYRYSTSTGKHIRDVQGVLHNLGVNYETIEAPQGLQRLEEAKNHYEGKINSNNVYMSKPKVRQKTKDSLKLENETYNNKLNFINIALGNNNAVILNKLGVK